MRHGSALLFSAALAIPLVAGCSSGGTGSMPGESRVGRDGGQQSIILENAASEVLRDVPASADRVWVALLTVYEELEIPVTDVREGARVIEAVGVRMRRIDGERLSRFYDCGSIMTGPVADRYQVTLSLQSTVTARGPGGSGLATETEAFAQSREARTGRLHCTSTGQLERLIAELVSEVVG